MRLYILLGILAAIPASQQSQQPPPVHCTIVVDDFGKGHIPHSAVRVQHWHYSVNNSQLIQDGFGFADDQGRVSFDLAPGSYEALASAQAFVPAVAFVEVYPGMEKPYVFRLAVRQGGHVEVEGTQK